MVSLKHLLFRNTLAVQDFSGGWAEGGREREVHISLRGEPVGLNWSEKERPLLPFFSF